MLGAVSAKKRELKLDRVAAALMTMAEAGQVHLLQRRHGPSDYTYIAVSPPARSASFEYTGLGEHAS